jgi:mannose-1-phosphate guanylyltransferase / phosphomannomutase
MQAIIMAGGKGTRLFSLTGGTIPKALFNLNNKPLIDYAIEHSIKNGCDNIIICTGYLGHKIQEYIEKKHYDATIQISQEKKPLGTAGALDLISKKLDNEFIILYADVYTTINIKKMLWFHKKRKADVTIAIHESMHPFDSTVVKIDSNGKIRKMIEKPGDNWSKYGNLTQTSLYIVKKGILNYIPKDTKIDFEKDIFPMMLKHGKKIYGYFTEEYAKDLGTPERYLEVVNQFTKE